MIFISYSRHDGATFADAVCDVLQKNGYQVWRDIRDLRPDKDFTADIETAIEQASFVVVCITPDTKRDNSFVRREIQYALANKIPVIPMRCADITPHISIVNNEWVNYYDNQSGAIERLLEIFTSAMYTNKPREVEDDPFKDYLEMLYKQIVRGLQRRIIRQIDLHGKGVKGFTQEIPASNLIEYMLSGATIDNISSDSDKIKIHTFQEGFIHYDGRVLLLGEPGAGKTITLMAYARDAVAARLENPELPLPLLGLIATWNAEKMEPLDQWLSKFYELEAERIQKIMDEGNLLLLLDGLDELGGKRSRNPYDPRERFLRILPKNNQIILTSRLKEYSEIGVQASLNGAILLQPLSVSQMKQYLQDQPAIWDLIRNDNVLCKVLQTPLLLSLFAFAYQGVHESERRQLKSLGSSHEIRDKIFVDYVEKAFEHEVRKFKSDLQYNLEEIFSSLGIIALVNVFFSTTLTHATIKDRDGELYNPSENYLVYNDFKWIKTDIGKDGIQEFVNTMEQLHLLIKENEEAWRFPHLLLRDMFAHYYSRANVENPKGINRTYAIDVLGYFRDPRDVDLLINSLSDHNPYIRARAAKALENFASGNIPIPIDPLIVALDDPDPDVRIGAARALGEIGDGRAISSLTERLSDYEKERYVSPGQTVSSYVKKSLEKIYRFLSD